MYILHIKNFSCLTSSTITVSIISQYFQGLPRDEHETTYSDMKVILYHTWNILAVNALNYTCTSIFFPQMFQTRSQLCKITLYYFKQQDHCDQTEWFTRIQKQEGLQMKMWKSVLIQLPYTIHQSQFNTLVTNSDMHETVIHRIHVLSHS